MARAFEQGEQVIVPLQGRGVVTSVEKLTLPGGGQETCYVVALEGRKGGRVVIPASRLSDYGLRQPMSGEEAQEAMSELNLPMKEEAEADQPSQTDLYRSLKDDLRTGQARSLARVVRRLYIFGLNNAVTDVHLKELERHAWGELINELAEAERATKANVQRTVRSALKSATPQEFLR